MLKYFLVLRKYLPLDFRGVTTFPSYIWENPMMPLLNGVLPLFKAQLHMNIFKSDIKHCYTNKSESQDPM